MSYKLIKSMMMKKFALGNIGAIVLLCAVAISVCSCEKREEQLKLDKDYLEVPRSGGSFVVSSTNDNPERLYISSFNWTQENYETIIEKGECVEKESRCVKSSMSWATAESPSDESAIHFTFEPNETGEPRYASALIVFVTNTGCPVKIMQLP